MPDFNPTQDDYIYHYKDYIQHIQWLMEGMCWIQSQLMLRMLTHDRTKIEADELDAYAEIVPHFKDFEYGTEEHEAHGNKLEGAWTHHTSHNKHHVEHFEQGMVDMTLIDIIEMVCDWRAASLRSGSFDYKRSLEIAKKSNSIPSMLAQIIENTCRVMDEQCQEVPKSQKGLP
jgi:Family of unknown function (DUF5662)